VPLHQVYRVLKRHAPGLCAAAEPM
jgi:hypothetical protein